MSEDDRTLGERVASAFENGYGDEGLVAECINGALTLVLVSISIVLAPLVAACWLVKKLLRHRLRSR